MTPVRPLTTAAASIPESPEVREMREAFIAGREASWTGVYITILALAIVGLMIAQIALVYS